MKTRTVERVRDWDSRPLSGGYGGLADLAAAEFSGAVEADGTWLFLLNGTAVGVFDGSIEDFESASGTAYEAPHLSLPLLFAMWERDGETRAQYYTEDTPLSETDETLTDANFVGYVELADNVLSGDYYAVYHGGRSMSAAFVGNAQELLTGEEAFERADNEVGVYEVVSVDLDIVDIPEPEPEPGADGTDETDAGAGETGASAAVTGAATGDATDEEAVDEADERAVDGVDESRDEATIGSSGPGAAEPEVGSETEADPEPGTNPDPAAGTGSTAEADASASTETEPAESSESTEPGGADRDAASVGSDPERESEPEAEPGERERRESAAADEDARADAERADGVEAEAGGGKTVFREEAQWRETTSVPALDPDESDVDAASAAETGEPDGPATPGSPHGPGAADEESTPRPESEAESRPARDRGADRSEHRNRPSDGAAERVEKLRRAVRDRDQRIESLREDLAAAEDRTEDLEATLSDVREERDRLESRVEELEAELAEARASAATATDAGGAAGGDERGPEEALAGTNLFVRYDSKAEPTLEDAAEADASDVNANLRLEHHTQFDADAVTVDGESYDEFLRGTAAYRFVSWAVRDLPYEIVETGHGTDLGDLFDAVVSVDRAELDGAVSVRDEEGEEVHREFDVVLRDRMGNPLLVAELNESREAVTGDEMAALVESAEVAREVSADLAGAVCVTSSFFEPGALEEAEEATSGGGFLSRSDRKSFVRTSRKEGFHLCLVEDRNGSFHVTVPEL